MEIPVKKYAVLFLVPMLLLAGCGEDDPGGPAGGSEITRPPRDPGAVMRDFLTAMEERDYDLYAGLLFQGYRLILQQETRDRFPDLGATLDRDQDLECMARLFGGEDLTDPSGNFVPGVLDISFGKITQLQDWRAVVPADPQPGEIWAPYEIEFLLNRGQQSSQILCRGQLQFFLIPNPVEYEGETRQDYTILGISDLTAADYKATESETYGAIKAIYRPSPED
jgi:hypothetical protein